jgi:hypothetical protein
MYILRTIYIKICNGVALFLPALAFAIACVLERSSSSDVASSISGINVVLGGLESPFIRDESADNSCRGYSAFLNQQVDLPITS